MKDNKKDQKKTSSAPLRPLGDRVIIQEVVVEEKGKKSIGSIIIPDTVNQDKGAKQGVVLAVGAGKYIDGKLVPLEVKTGDSVLFSWGEKVEIDSQEYYIVQDNNILAVIK